jgi:hypothetical protein
MNKNFLLILMSVCLAISVMAQSGTKLDENNGFKTYKFGDKLKPYLALRTFSDNNIINNQHVLRIPGKDLTVGDIPVKCLDLYFIDDSLAKIEVFFNVKYNEDIIAAVKNVFGAPDSSHFKNDTTGEKENISAMIAKECYWHGKNINLSYSDLSNRFYNNAQKDSPIYKRLTVSLVYKLNSYENLVEGKKEEVKEVQKKSDF